MSYNNAKNSYIDNDGNEIEFYTGYVTPADEWQVTKSSLFREFTGSVFRPTTKMPFRLAKLNEIVAFSSSPDTKKVNKKNYVDERFNFLQEFIPEQIYTKIIEIMAFTDNNKKKIARDISMNVETLSSILSLWQLELHSTGSYVTEKALVDINEFLKEISTFSEFRYKGHVTTKDIERAEARILRQLYNQISGNDEQEESNQTSKKLPSEVLNYYRDFMIHLEGHLNERQRGLLEKTTNQRPTLPFHIYLLAQKIDLMKKILYKVSLDYLGIYIEKEDYNNLCKIIDDFYKNKKAIVGELITQALALLEIYYQKQAKVEKMPKRFQSRIKKYRIEYEEEYLNIIAQIKDKTIVKEENEETNEIVKDIHNHLHNLSLIKEPENVTPAQQDLILGQKTTDIDKHRRLYNRYRFVSRISGIPDELYNAIIDILVWYDKTTFNWSIKNKDRINMTTIALILSCWQLIVYEQDSIISELQIDKMCEYLQQKLWNNGNPIFTSKMLERGQTEILRKMYTEKYYKKSNKIISESKNSVYSL